MYGWTFRAANAIAQHVKIAHLLGGTPPRWTQDEKCMNPPQCQVWCDVQVDGVNVPAVCLMFDNAMVFLKAVVSSEDEVEDEMITWRSHVSSFQCVCLDSDNNVRFKHIN